MAVWSTPRAPRARDVADRLVVFEPLVGASNDAEFGCGKNISTDEQSRPGASLSFNCWELAGRAIHPA